MKEIPSLSKILDEYLTVDVVPGGVKTRDHMQQITVSIPSEDYAGLSTDELVQHYLRPLVKSLGQAINKLGNVFVAQLPLPPNLPAVSCTQGKIPVTLIIVRRSDPDRHQILISTLVEPANEDESNEACER